MKEIWLDVNKWLPSKDSHWLTSVTVADFAQLCVIIVIFVFYLTMLSAGRLLASHDTMSSELERIWKEVVVA
jgi:hypothetical protein